MEETEKIITIAGRLRSLLGKDLNGSLHRVSFSNELTGIIAEARGLASSEEEMLMLEEGAISSLKNALHHVTAFETKDDFGEGAVDAAENTVHHYIVEAIDFFEEQLEE